MSTLSYPCPLPECKGVLSTDSDSALENGIGVWCEVCEASFWIKVNSSGKISATCVDLDPTLFPTTAY